MITIAGYKKVGYLEFLNALNIAREESGKSHLKIAAEINAKTAETARNAFKEKDGEQVVADKVLTKVMKCISLNGFIVWFSGKKYYYLEN